jgi:hypothetical protein
MNEKKKIIMLERRTKLFVDDWHFELSNESTIFAPPKKHFRPQLRRLFVAFFNPNSIFRPEFISFFFFENHYDFQTLLAQFEID